MEHTTLLEAVQGIEQRVGRPLTTLYHSTGDMRVAVITTLREPKDIPKQLRELADKFEEDYGSRHKTKLSILHKEGSD